MNGPVRLLRLAALCGCLLAASGCPKRYPPLAVRDEAPPVPPAEPAARAPEIVAAVAGRTVYRLDGAVFFRAGMAICADGAPDAYHPLDTGTDRLANAGRPGHWWALATHDDRSDGRPVVQGDEDPAPGHYVSMTALIDPAYAHTDPRRYVDANRVPYVVLPLGDRFGAELGDFCVVLNSGNGRTACGQVADLGPRDKLGEGSIALAEALDVPADPRVGGAADGIVYLVFPGSGPRRPLPPEASAAAARRLLADWGGLGRLRSCALTATDTPTTP